MLEGLTARWDYLTPLYVQDLEEATPQRMTEAVGRISATAYLGDAVADADLIIESVPELLEIKQETWGKEA